MSIRNNKARADRLAVEAHAERYARQAHVAYAKSIFKRRLVSPAGLAASFCVGALAGLRLGRDDEARSRGSMDYEAHEDQGLVQRFTDSTVGNILTRLATAALVRYALSSGNHDERHGENHGEDIRADLAANDPAIVS